MKYRCATARTSTRVRPILEDLEGRLAPSAGSLASTPVIAAIAKPKANPLAVYRTFSLTITRGPDAGLTLSGPIVLGYAGRIQVIGILFNSDGRRFTVAGTIFGGAANLRLVIPKPHGTVAVELTGKGILANVRGGLPDGLALVGAGNGSGPVHGDAGSWRTAAAGR